ncbi:hypothetical protein ACIPK7_04020 [Pseudomonas sp. NPDC086581]|uniref:hypothetical protein n=1 Tax=Pseudomonas sp. NPDC086581 TaxID=3364432 RepID=UPI0037F9F023
MDFLGGLFGAVKLLREGVAYVLERRDSFHQQAARVIAAFKAHGLAPNVAADLMEEGLIEDPSVFERPKDLKPHLRRITPWAAELLQLDPAWFKGRTSRAHKDIDDLQEFLLSKTFKESTTERFDIYVFKTDDSPIHQSKGDFCVILEECFTHLDDEEFDGVYRYYYLTHGAHFEHYKCFLQLMSIAAVAHLHSIPIWGRVMSSERLSKLDQGAGLIPDLWRDKVGKSWYVEDAIWTSLGAPAEWVLKRRPDLDDYLRRIGRNDVLEKLVESRPRLEGG